MRFCPAAEDGRYWPDKRVVEIERSGLNIRPVLLAGLIEISGLLTDGPAIQGDPVVGVAPVIGIVESSLPGKGGACHDVIVAAITQGDELGVDEIKPAGAHSFEAHAMPGAVDAQAVARAGRAGAFRKERHSVEGSIDEIIVKDLSLAITHFQEVDIVIVVVIDPAIPIGGRSIGPRAQFRFRAIGVKDRIEMEIVDLPPPATTPHPDRTCYHPSAQEIAVVGIAFISEQS